MVDSSKSLIEPSFVEGLKETNFDQINVKSRIIAYQPDLFAKITSMDGINYAELMDSLSLRENRQNVFKAGQGAGASG